MKSTILNYLDALADNFVVYSTHMKGVCTLLKDNDLYIYIYQHCMVVVCIDNGVPADELADEEPINGHNPRYFVEDSYRTSPVWSLHKVIEQLQEKLMDIDLEWTVWGVLLTESNFLNAVDMRFVWQDMGVIVMDMVKGLAGRHFEVNPDDELMADKAVMGVFDGIAQLAEPEEPLSEAEEEFQQLLRQFLDGDSGNCEDEHAAKETEEQEEQQEEQQEEEEEEEQEQDPPTCTLESLDLPDNDMRDKVRILPPLATPQDELDKLVGCSDIKARIDELLALKRYNQMVLDAFPHLQVPQVSLHSVFLGRPGTGKTTVCKIFGSLLHQAGALSKGHVVVADRGTFIGPYWGDEESNVRQVLELAQGGVLMIDEAYLLNGKHDHDPGKLVLQLLMEVLGDESQRDLAVVLCGYKKPMMSLLDTNPGLQSRFPNHFEFNDFTVDELMEITHRRVGQFHYRFTEPAWQKFREVLMHAYQVRDPESWGNARFVANQLERIYLQHARRCVNEQPADSEQLLLLTPADIMPIDVARPRPRIGF